MDFHSLSRRDLQTLCKKNMIPANMTNVAMADALQALKEVEGIDAIQAETQQFLSPRRAEARSPDLPRTSRRTSARRKPNPQETSLARTRREASKRTGKEEETEKEEQEYAGLPVVEGLLSTPATLNTRGRRTRTLIAQCSTEVEVEGEKKEKQEKGVLPAGEDIFSTRAILDTRGRRARTVIEKEEEKKKGGGGPAEVPETPAAATGRRASVRRGTKTAPVVEEVKGETTALRYYRTRQSSRRRTDEVVAPASETTTATARARNRTKGKDAVKMASLLAQEPEQDKGVGGDGILSVAGAGITPSDMVSGESRVEIKDLVEEPKEEEKIEPVEIKGFEGPIDQTVEDKEVMVLENGEHGESGDGLLDVAGAGITPSDIVSGELKGLLEKPTEDMIEPVEIKGFDGVIDPTVEELLEIGGQGVIVDGLPDVAGAGITPSDMVSGESLVEKQDLAESSTEEVMIEPVEIKEFDGLVDPAVEEMIEPVEVRGFDGLFDPTVEEKEVTVLENGENKDFLLEKSVDSVEPTAKDEKMDPSDLTCPNNLSYGEVQNCIEVSDKFTYPTVEDEICQPDQDLVTKSGEPSESAGEIKETDGTLVTVGYGETPVGGLGSLECTPEDNPKAVEVEGSYAHEEEDAGEYDVDSPNTGLIMDHQVMAVEGNRKVEVEKCADGRKEDEEVGADLDPSSPIEGPCEAVIFEPPSPRDQKLGGEEVPTVENGLHHDGELDLDLDLLSSLFGEITVASQVDSSVEGWLKNQTPVTASSDKHIAGAAAIEFELPPTSEVPAVDVQILPASETKQGSDGGDIIGDSPDPDQAVKEGEKEEEEEGKRDEADLLDLFTGAKTNESGDRTADDTMKEFPVEIPTVGGDLVGESLCPSLGPAAVVFSDSSEAVFCKIGGCGDKENVALSTKVEKDEEKKRQQQQQQVNYEIMSLRKLKSVYKGKLAEEGKKKERPALASMNQNCPMMMSPKQQF